MKPRPSFDRSLLIPIVIAVVSILGIGWLLSISDLAKSLIRPTAIPSSVNPPEADGPTSPPFAFPTQEEPSPSPAPSRQPPTQTFTPTSTLTDIPPSPSPTLTPDQIQPFPAGKYDDQDPNIAYDRYWNFLKNLGTKNSYYGTIHLSTGIGAEISFRFTGKRLRLGYQRGKNFGTVTVIIDGQSYGFNEQAFDFVWSSPVLSEGDHFVRIIHESGESINLDYLEVLP